MKKVVTKYYKICLVAIVCLSDNSNFCLRFLKALKLGSRKFLNGNYVYISNVSPADQRQYDNIFPAAKQP